MDKNNPAFTGFFKNDHKRIDLVFVIKEKVSTKVEERRTEYLTNILKFGLELEFDIGKMSEHRSLIFVKVHAPESIVEEYGIYFNVRRYFKDNHLEYINPFVNPLGVRHERELINLIREQYQEPVHYSTLERSKIVYNIIQQLSFGKDENVFGINHLLEQNVILDVFALHDGPYFIASGQQSIHINGRQALFYNWVGIVNIWRTQPINMIHEYLGERVAFYFAYYDYFNLMLLIPTVLGLLTALKHYYGEIRLDSRARHMCHSEELTFHLMCPQCRHFDLCPFRLVSSYCRELKFIKSIDSSHTITYAFFVSLWSIMFAMLWFRREKYLMWLWEVKKAYHEHLTNPEYYSNYGRRMFQKSHLTGLILEKFQLKKFFYWFLRMFVFSVLFVAWLYLLLLLCTQIWYVKFWLDIIYNKETFPKERHNEHLFIAIGAAVYSIITTGLKMVAKILSHSITALENNKTIKSYSCSSAIKLYAFCFTGTFALLTFHTFVGHFFYTHILDMNSWYSTGGFKVMSNKLGSSFDDICITLAVAVIIEQIIVKIPLYLSTINTDYPSKGSNAPCWEKEYKLVTLKENYFHNEYNNIAIQYAMATLFSLTFTLAPFFILFMNVLDVRHKAKTILLSYRRPLLLNSARPAVWHFLILAISFLVPIFNLFVIGLQSRNFLTKFAIAEPSSALIYYNHQWSGYYIKTEYDIFALFNSSLGEPSPLEEMKKISTPVALTGCYELCNEKYFYNEKQGTFFLEFSGEHLKAYKYEFLLLYGAGSILINLFIYFTFPTESNDLKDTLNTESRIKQRHYVQKGFLPNYAI